MRNSSSCIQCFKNRTGITQQFTERDFIPKKMKLLRVTVHKWGLCLYVITDKAEEWKLCRTVVQNICSKEIARSRNIDNLLGPLPFCLLSCSICLASSPSSLRHIFISYFVAHITKLHVGCQAYRYLLESEPSDLEREGFSLPCSSCFVFLWHWSKAHDWSW